MKEGIFNHLLKDPYLSIYDVISIMEFYIGHYPSEIKKEFKIELKKEFLKLLSEY